MDMAIFGVFAHNTMQHSYRVTICVLTVDVWTSAKVCSKKAQEMGKGKLKRRYGTCMHFCAVCVKKRCKMLTVIFYVKH